MEKLHILKGNSGTLGINVMFKVTSLFEQKIKNSSTDGIADDIDQLKSSLSKFKQLLENDKIFIKYE